MAQTPANRILARLREREAARTRRDEAIRAARATYEASYPHEVETLLDDAATLAGLDEREPEPVKRTALLAREKVNTLLSMLPPDLAHAAKALTTPELAQLLISAKARRLGDHVGAIEREIGGRS